MHKQPLFYIAIILIALSSCRKDFDTILSTGELSFSKDTVYLDTVFTNIGSSTYKLKVYNKSNRAISIPSITLGKGTNSFYRLNVDGTPGKSFENVEILAKDSIYIFIETTIDYTQVTDPIYTDAIVFDNGINTQDVKLVTLVQDTYFLYPSKDANGIIETINLGVDADGNPININGFYLNGDTVFTNEKPYVIYGYCAVPENSSLTINAGAKIYFHANSGLIVSNNATLNVNGSLSNEVIFEGDRLEPDFSNIPGQWGAIWLREGSINNSINYAIIKNASVGIIADAISNITTPTLTIKNSQIYNSANFGLLGRETSIYGENIVINNSGQSSLACTIGGSYTFIHSTFTNFWSNSFRDYPTVLINNYYTYTENNTEMVVIKDLSTAHFTNCIIDGNNNIELVIDKAEGAIFNYKFENNLFKFDDYNNVYGGIPEYNFEDLTYYSNNIINGFSDFKSPQNNELIIGNSSDAIQNAAISGTLLAPSDILGNTRPTPADIGAYQHTTF